MIAPFSWSPRFGDSSKVGNLGFRALGLGFGVVWGFGFGV